MINRHTVSVSLPADNQIAMLREFDAPRHLVFKALTTPALVKRWLLGPPGWSMPVCDIDLRVGGRYRYVWQRDDSDVTMGMGGVYREIEAPARIVNTEKFDQPWYEGEAQCQWVFEESNGKTVLSTTLTYISQAVRDGVLKSEMEKGVNASYDRLDDILATGSID